MTVAALWHRLPVYFDEQLEILVRRVDELHFDDGYDDVVRAAAALEARDRRGVFFIVPTWLRRPSMTTKLRVRQLADRGHVIGNHTWSHPDVRKLGSALVRIQLERARDWLQDATGQPIDRLAWPYGLHDDRADAIAAELGYAAPRGIQPTEVFAPRALTGAQLKRIPLATFAGHPPADEDEDDAA